MDAIGRAYRVDVAQAGDRSDPAYPAQPWNAALISAGISAHGQGLFTQAVAQDWCQCDFELHNRRFDCARGIKLYS